MRNLTFALALLAAPAAFAQQDDLYRELKLGDRVQVTFRHGSTLTGMLVAVSADPKVRVESLDYTKETVLTLDMSWEYPGLTGTMTIPKDQIKDLRKLQALSATDKKNIEEQRKIAEDVKKREEEERRAAAKIKEEKALKALEEKLKGEAQGGNEAEKLKQLDQLKKSLELRKRFPPPEWGPKTLDEIAARNIRRQPITPEQREFMENYKIWLLAEQYEEIKGPEKKEEKKEAPPEK